MKQFLISYLRKLMLVFLLIPPCILQAGITRYNIPLTGSAITYSATLGLQDDKYSYMLTHHPQWHNEFCNKEVNDIVRLKYNETANVQYSNPWEIRIKFVLHRWNENGSAMPDENGQLKITYDPSAGTIYRDQAVFSSTGGYKTLMEIKASNSDTALSGIVITGSISTMPDDVSLESEIEVERYYIFDQETVPGLYSYKDVKKNTLEFSWDFLPGAEEYDLEWVFKSYYDASTVVDWKNATRITTTGNTYIINLAYDKGTIMFRIRGVGLMETTYVKRKEGKWSAPKSLPLDNLDADRNWKYSSAFAEGGKAKEEVDFFDGSHRQRQAVTLNNTDSTALITETFYDYEGRATIQTMLAPDKDHSPNLKYYSDFNLYNTPDVVYDKQYFDNDAYFANCLVSSPAGLNTFQGASNYYSADNPFKDVSNYGMIPDANQYPFAQTVYGTDGRVRMQSKPGNDLKTGSGHETKYYYATPLQGKLDRLFGSEVGDASHYTQTMVQDENGQLSLSYTNLSGKVIATSLVGDSPANVDALPENTGFTQQTDDFNSKNHWEDAEGAMVIDTRFLVTNANTGYTFTYTMTPEQYSQQCSGDHDCVYDLSIIVYNTCPTEVTGTYPPGQLYAFSGSISHEDFYLGAPYTRQFTVTFPRVGSYQIVKKLTIDQAALNSYITSLSSSSCFPDLGTIPIDLSDCGTCAEFYCRQGCEDEATNANLTKGSEAWNAYVATCMLSCSTTPQDCETTLPTSTNCSSLLDILISDMSPGGQYFDDQPVADLNNTTFIADNNWLNFIGVDRDYPNTSLDDTPPNVWPDNNSQAWEVANFRDAQGVLITSWAGLRANWQSSFATKLFDNTNSCNCNGSYPTIDTYQSDAGNPEVVISGSGTGNAPTINGRQSLVEFHPEYCHYLWCEDMQQSRLFDDHLSTISTFTAAVAAGYIDGNLTTPPAIGKGLLDADPFFTNNGQGVGQYSAMLNYLTYYDGLSTPSMWVEAGDINNTSNDAQWQAFVALYKTRKSKFEKDVIALVPCAYMHDATVPPDNIAEQNDAFENGNPMVAGFYIRVPDINEVNSYADPNLSPNPFETGIVDNYSLETFSEVATDQCLQVGTVTLCLDYISPTISNSQAIEIDISDGTGYQRITSLNACFNVNDPAILVSALANDINNYVSSPVDYTALVSEPTKDCPYGLTIYVPTYLGEVQISAQVLCNNCLSPVGACSLFLTPFTYSWPVYVECPQMELNCTCMELKSLKEQYDDAHPGSHTLTEYATYMAGQYNTAFNLTEDDVITPTQMETWITNCQTNQGSSPELLDVNGNPVSVTLPHVIDCQGEEDCGEESHNIADYYALLQYNTQQQETINDFKDDYIHHCFNGSEYSESLEVSYPDKEYHYTLYYYDQSGNLTRTVPPEGVVPLTLMYDANTHLSQVEQHRADPGHCPTVTTSHKKVSNYKYTTLNSPYEQTTPDAGTSTFYYDRVGRLRFSQNAQQADDDKYSYTKYDGQSRIKEVGESSQTVTYVVPGSNPVIDYELLPMDPLVTGAVVNDNTFPDQDNEQITRTTYDAQTVLSTGVLTQDNLRSRVASATLDMDGDGNYESATHYSYDVHGNVKDLIQDIPALAVWGADQQYKRINYEYDLVSGNVNRVTYQPGEGDQFMHKYEYDDDNRLTNAYTSRNNLIWDQDAEYFYYLHGPLARTELGEHKVQGLDYAYTLLGWIKGVNSESLNAQCDIGKDGALQVQDNLNSMTGRDAFGYTLGYFTNDYSPIKTVLANEKFIADKSNATYLATDAPDLYNGNISNMVTSIYNDLGAASPQLTAYKFDQLNRITQMISNTNLASNAWGSGDNLIDNIYKSTFAYDADGNITTLSRNGENTTTPAMDDLKYYYLKADNTVYDPTVSIPSDATNKLAYVDDFAGATTVYTDDIEPQSTGNYTYDNIGNLKSDVSEEIADIEWTVYGKVKSITRTTGSTKPNLVFAYDATGNRISKTAIITGHSTTTYYIRDAQGNIMTTYEVRPNELDALTLYLADYSIYGSSRLGMLTVNEKVSNLSLGAYCSRELGSKEYELANHLGNVLTTITDRKIAKDVYGYSQHTGGGNGDWTHTTTGSLEYIYTPQAGTYDQTNVSDNKTDYYIADISSSQDYYPFGMLMPGRSFSSDKYKFGFNGKEKDDEITGVTGANLDFGARIYDSRVGRWLSTDPWFKKYPSYSSYNFTLCNPISYMDNNGKGVFNWDKTEQNYTGTTNANKPDGAADCQEGTTLVFEIMDINTAFKAVTDQFIAGNTLDNQGLDLYFDHQPSPGSQGSTSLNFVITKNGSTASVNALMIKASDLIGATTIRYQINVSVQKDLTDEQALIILSHEVGAHVETLLNMVLEYQATLKTNPSTALQDFKTKYNAWVADNSGTNASADHLNVANNSGTYGEINSIVRTSLLPNGGAWYINNLSIYNGAKDNFGKSCGSTSLFDGYKNTTYTATLIKRFKLQVNLQAGTYGSQKDYYNDPECAPD